MDSVEVGDEERDREDEKQDVARDDCTGRGEEKKGQL